MPAQLWRSDIDRNRAILSIAYKTVTLKIRTEDNSHWVVLRGSDSVNELYNFIIQLCFGLDWF